MTHMWVWSRSLCRWVLWRGSRAAWLALPAAIAVAGYGCLPIPGPLPPAPAHVVPAPVIAPPVEVLPPLYDVPPDELLPPPACGAAPWGYAPPGFVPVIGPSFISPPSNEAGKINMPPDTGSNYAPNYSENIPVPVPEPGTLPVLATAALMLAAWRMKGVGGMKAAAVLIEETGQ